MRRANLTLAAAPQACLLVAALLCPVCYAAPDRVSESTCPDAARMRTVESGFKLEQLMRQRQIPGIGVAVIEDFKVVCAKGYGVTQKDGSDPVTPSTLFMAGSISKPVTAVGALYLVEQGRLSLDEDVNVKLRSWKVPDNGFTMKHKVTLGLLLDHTGGFTGGDFFPGYTVGAPLPSLAQILDGVPPASNQPMRIGFVPGTKWQYSGDGYLVIQQLITDAAGTTFPEFMRTAVFEKLGMRESTYEQPLRAERAAFAASGTLASGRPVDGRWRINPELAAGGLWSTPSDLARLAIELALSAKGKANHVLSRASVRRMFTAHWEKGVVNILGTKDDPDGMGYGFFVGKRNGRFGHIGGNVGYQAALLMFGDTGNGIVIMTNSDVGLTVGYSLLDQIAKVYGWNYVAPPLP